MHAHKTHVTISADHELRLRLPADFPAGEAEVIVLSTRDRPPVTGDRVERLNAWIASLPPVPSTPPLDAFDRGEIYR
jgi:hypothetical protein